MKVWLLLYLILIVTMIGTVSADTLLVYTTNTTDGNAYRGTDGTFTAVRNGAGTAGASGNAPVAELATTTTSDQFDRMDRAIFWFNTSPLPDDAIINSANIGLYKQITSVALGDSGIGITRFTIDGTIDAADYDNFNNDRYADDKLLSTMSTAQYYNWSLNSLGLSNISKTGNSAFMARIAWDIDNTSPTWASSKASFIQTYGAESVTKVPFIEIVYTPASSSPVASFTCTKNFLRIPNSVTCTDSSTNTPTSWSWSMGDGSAAITTQNVTYQYSKRGSWGITLNATNAGGSNVTPAATNVKVVGYENYY